MSKFVKDVIKNIEISGIRQFNAYARTFDNVIYLTIGELDFNTPDNIKEKAIKAINRNQTRYTTNKGIESLRKLIAKKYGYKKDEVILTVGTTEGLSILIKSVIDKDDEIIIPTPGYVGYKPLIDLEKGIVKELDLTKYDITTESLENLLTLKTKAILITSPNNPTGKVYTKEEMIIIKDFVLKHDLLLISDEIYSSISYNEYHSFSEFKELYSNLVILSGYSKSHAMTGFRIGYLISNVEMINELVKIHQYSVTSTSTISQLAALEAERTQNYLFTSSLQKRRDKVIKALDDLKLEYIQPDGAFYVFYKHNHDNSLDYCKKLLEQQKVALIPGAYFLGNHDDYVRLSFAIDDSSLEKALNKIKDFHKK